MDEGQYRFHTLLEKLTGRTSTLKSDKEIINRICDLIREQRCEPGYAILELRKKLRDPDRKVAGLVLRVLETVLENCGTVILGDVLTGNLIEELENLDSEPTAPPQLDTKIKEREKTDKEFEEELKLALALSAAEVKQKAPALPPRNSAAEKKKKAPAPPPPKPSTPTGTTLSVAAGSSTPSFKTNVDNECVFCFENPKDSACYPCGHMSMCFNCLTNYWKTENNPFCPICRAVIENVIRIYRS